MFVSPCVVSFFRKADKKFPMEDFKKKFAESLATTTLSSHTPVEEAAKIWADLKGFVNSHIPKKLYRFRPCNADSFISLEQATISICVVRDVLRTEIWRR